MLIETVRNKSSYLTWEGEFGSIVFTNHLAITLSIMMHPMKCTHTLPSLQIPRHPSDFSLPFRDPNLFGALHVGNDLIWHLNAFGPIVGLPGASGRPKLLRPVLT